MEVHSARWCVTVLAAAALLAVSPAAGQDKAPQPAAAQKPAIIPTSVFAASSPYGDEPQLSPDGKHVAYFFEAGGASWIGVIDIDKGDVVNRFPIPKGNELLWISWAGDHRLLLSLLVSEKNAYFEARFTRLFVYDTTNDNFFFVGPKTEGLDGDNVIYTDPDGKFVLLSVQRDLYTEPQVWRFSLDRDADKGEKIEARGGVWHWITRQGRRARRPRCGERQAQGVVPQERRRQVGGGCQAEGRRQGRRGVLERGQAVRRTRRRAGAQARPERPHRLAQVQLRDARGRRRHLRESRMGPRRFRDGRAG
jgi:hypothetical protein